jgi:hypothetical protein
MEHDSTQEKRADPVKDNGPIPTHWAFQLCDMICQENLVTRFSLAKLICRRCQNNPKKMGFARRSDNRACFLVNSREAHYRQAFHRSPN